ncbi:hypothetical protein DL765_008210 [Monosporascus sp. GIB2]|nr:hypothetical protein DL765_008210 [Monosporascus sp. GIB2]
MDVNTVGTLDITRTEANQALYWFDAAAIEYGVMIGLARRAVPWLYRRVFSPVRWSMFGVAIVSLVHISLIPDHASVPIFATIGLVIRLQNSGNPDTSWKQPEVLLRGAADLASGNLCVCFPELAVLSSKRKRKGFSQHRPTASEFRGWSEPNRATKPPSIPYLTKSLMSTTFSTNGDAQYIELQDHGNDVRVTSMRNFPREEQPGDGAVVLRNEIKVKRQELSL